MRSLKLSLAVARAHGFIRGWPVANASAHNGTRLRIVVAKSITVSTVWTDSAYRSNSNEERLEKKGLPSAIRQGKQMPETMSRTRGRRSKVRSGAEHVFARQKDKIRLVRPIGMSRAKVKIGMVKISYNMQRYAWRQGRTTST